jgi:hypothetical protein
LVVSIDFKVYLPVSGDSALPEEPDSPGTKNLHGAGTVPLVTVNEQERNPAWPFSGARGV